MAHIAEKIRARPLLFLAAAAVLALLLSPRLAAAQACGGDCNGDGTVAVNELVVGVNIASGIALLSVCPVMDIDSSQAVEIADLVRSVLHLLEGCPAVSCPAPAGGRCVEITPGEDAQDSLLGALLEAQPKDLIILRAGSYTFDQPLSLDVSDVTIRGEGIDTTVLDFSAQTTGGESLLVSADRFTIEDLAIVDGPGDMIKVLGADGVTFRRVRTEWTNGPDVENGAYGLYPVQCRNVLIEDSVVKGASDAGIYVGQSRNIVVRRNQVEFNVAGIEIENSTDADVYENVATNNTGGILIFNLPGPPIQDGRRTRVYNNQIFENNTPNFAEPGSSVAGVPKGTGTMVLSNDQVEVFGNTFRDNDSTHVLLVSYNTAEFFGQSPANNPEFDPYSETIFIHDNTFTGGGMEPDLPELVVQFVGGLPVPNIVVDGDENPAKLVEGQLPAALRTCVQQPGATFVNLDIAGGFTQITHDLETVNCTHAPLPPIRLAEGRTIEISPGPQAEDQILTALLEAEPGDDILLRAGRYTLTSQLSLDGVDHVTLRGEGIDQTILDFSGLTTGGEGLLLRANDFTLRDLAFENAPGDQFKAEGCDGLRIQRVRAEWTGGPNTDNGAYGLYPVQCKDVLIEDSVVKGASDAGIYVGQSRNIIVRRNRVELNVAGIEIENSTAADVYQNVATNNTGGILVFNLPGLPVYGERTRVYDNQIVANNTANFAPAGNIVATVPDGTGMLILANDGLEVFGNEFRDNNSVQLSAISYNTAVFLGSTPASDPAFDPFSESIYFLDNTFIGGGAAPDSDLDLVVTLVGGTPIPQLIIDGDVDADKLVGGELPDALRTCIQEPAVTFVNLNLPGFPTTLPSMDLAPYDCTLRRLNPVAMAGVR